MGAESKIEWTDATWPVVKGCDYVSPGCANCYAADLIHRHAQHPNEKISLPLAGLTEVRNGRARWTAKVYLNEPHLNDPLKWKTGRMIFVPSHGDLFHEDVPDEFICRVFKVMGQAKQHTFQVLTKRAERMQRFMREQTNAHAIRSLEAAAFCVQWPLPNVWLGVSVENQATADERIPQLLKTPAAVRFLSCEPLLDEVDLSNWIMPNCPACHTKACMAGPVRCPELLDWVIVGGESGPGARPFNVDWARSLVRQCREAGVPVFVKQLGANVVDRCEFFTPENTGWPEANGPANWDNGDITLKDAKGGDPEEWPASLRVREFPTAKTRAA
jgi:protein gp37